MRKMKTSPKEMAKQRFRTSTSKRQMAAEVVQEAAAFKIQKKLITHGEVMLLKPKRAKQQIMGPDGTEWKKMVSI
nr:hypothetical protein CFP56_32960 [Quercus suber]